MFEIQCNCWDQADTGFNSGKEPEKLDKDLTSLFRTNAVAYAHLINAFMPLVLLGKAKKVIVMTTGMADTELTRNYDLWMGVSYSVSKAALDMLVAKFSAEYREQGVLVLGISPGFVATNDVSGGKSTYLFPDYHDHEV